MKNDQDGAKQRPHPTTFVDRKRLDLIKGYEVHEKRTPSRELPIVTPAQTIGPFFPRGLIGENDNDLTRWGPDQPRCEGDLICAFGDVTDEDGNSVRGALIEVWQANKWGKYDHPADITDQPLDENFRGFGRALTDAHGRYAFVSILPGAYLNPGYDDWYRPPHIHFSIFAAGLMQRIITQMYFPDHDLNDIDPILNGIEDLNARARLIASAADAPAGAPETAQGYRFDIVLRGRIETPFFTE